MPHATHSSGTAPFFLTRGLVLAVRDLETVDWPTRTKRAGLTTLATHIFPHEVAAFVKTDAGQKFLGDCKRLGIAVEHELHAMGDLLPRDLYDKDPALFPMDETGTRVRGYNLCVHSGTALDIVAANVAKYTRLLPSTTGRYFYWIDDGKPMCRCPKCRHLSDSDQALIVENHMLQAIHSVDARATLAHLVYLNTLQPPTQVKPLSGIFVEYAPIRRRFDRPLSDRTAVRPDANGMSHGAMLDFLDANLQVFGRDGAQALEYWLDASLFANWKRDNLRAIPWDDAVYRDDLRTYARRGVRHITTFAAWLDADYLQRFREPPVAEYGKGMQEVFTE